MSMTGRAHPSSLWTCAVLSSKMTVALCPEGEGTTRPTDCSPLCTGSTQASGASLQPSPAAAVACVGRPLAPPGTCPPVALPPVLLACVSLCALLAFAFGPFVAAAAAAEVEEESCRRVRRACSREV